MAKVNKRHEALMTIEARLKVCQEYTRLWSDFARFFSDGFDGREIFDQDEQNFFNMIGVLAANHFRYVESAGNTFKSGDDILKLLGDLTSLRKLADMSEAAFSKMMLEWHSIFINMNKSLGKLMHMKAIEDETRKPRRGQAVAAKPANPAGV
jgi:hypothetical protein